MIIMLDKNGEEWDVEEKNFDAAIAKGFTPALEMVSPEGEEVLVKRPDLDAALSKGYEYKVVAEAKKTAAEMPGDTIPAYAVPGYGAQDMVTFGLSGDVAGLESKLRGKGFEQGRNEYRQRSKQAQQESPWLYMLGQAIGMTPTMGVGALASKATPALSSLSSSLGGLALQGGATGALSVYGESEGTPAERLEKAPIGAMYGAGLNTALFGGGALAKALGKRVLGTPEELAYRATGATLANRRQLKSKEPEQVGRALLEENVIGLVPRSKEVLSDRASARIGALEDLNDQMVIDTAKSGGKVSTKNIVTELGDKANKFANQLPTSNMDTSKAIQKERQAIIDKYGILDPETNDVVSLTDLTPREAVELKRLFSKERNYVAPGVSIDPRKLAEQETSSTIRGQILKDMEAQLGKEKAAEYASNNLRQGNLITGRNILEDQMFRDKNRKKMGLTDWLAAGTGASIGGLPGATAGLGLYGSKKLIEQFGPQLGAKIGYEYSKLAREKGYKLARDEIARRFGQAAGNIVSQQEQQ